MKSPITLILLLAACTSKGPGPSTEPGGTQPPPPTTSIQPGGTFAAAGDALKLVYPVRVAAAADGAIYTSDFAANAVIGTRDGVPFLVLRDLAQPLGLAVAGDLLYVGSAGRHSVEVYDLTQRRGVRAVAGFEKPNAIAVAPDGVVYVADSKRDRVWVLDRELATIATIGERGSGDGQLLYPVSVAVDDTRVVVADQGNHRLSIFDRGGRFVRNVGSEMTRGLTADDYRGRFTTIGSVALAGEDLYVLDSAHSYVQVLDGQGAPKGFLGHAGECDSCVKLALDIAVGTDGRVFATDPEHRRLVTLSTELR